ncbi:MAG: molybdopterin-dependent oxidoreductase [Pseudomonadota bacterium]
MAAKPKFGLTANHWGIGLAEVENGRVVAVHPHPVDPDPSEINANVPQSLHGTARIRRPAIREGWLTGTGERGRDRFVEVEWSEVIDILARELTRVRKDHGNGSIFAGSYGWSSAGRIHHAQSLLKRFLNGQGGFVSSEGNYSFNAALVLMPHIVGNYRQQIVDATRWPVVAKHTNLVVAFGGLARRNAQVSDGGLARHLMRDNLRACAKAGVRFVNLSPFKGDMDDDIGADWLPPKPGTDTAVMLGLAHSILQAGAEDRAFLYRYSVGFDVVEAYIRGQTDGVPKDADWAAEISGVSADRIRALASEMSSGRTLVTCAAGLQRGDFGEQPLWMTVTLAAMLGQIGLPGGGFGIGYAVNGTVGNVARPFRWGTMGQGKNPISDFIPVACTSDMLLNPGGSYVYNGQTRRFPHIRMIWWAGGNPFHHHQDLNRLRAAFQRPETIVVNEINWTATARHADIVLPVAAPEERTDFGGGKADNCLVPMPALVPPEGEARLEFDIYADIAKRLGDRSAFTQGMEIEEWSQKIWDDTRKAATSNGINLPTWEAFLAGDIIQLSDPSEGQVFLADYRADPDAAPLPTPSGRIELFSERIASFGLSDCPGHATYLPPRDVTLGKHPLALLSGQPGTRLHSQLDNGAASTGSKIAGREPVLIHPSDAAERGICEGDVVEIWNDRGRCLAGARLSDAIREGSLFLWTGAWYDPEFGTPQDRDRHGNPNVLTHDNKTSSLSQSPAAHSAMVDIARFQGTPPPVEAHLQPAFARMSLADIQNSTEMGVKK